MVVRLPVQTFTCAYRYGGGTHIVHIEAESPSDASRKLRAIGMTGQVDGVLIAELPLEGHHGWLTQLRQLFTRRKT